jgi:molecular chaperone GrpE
MRNPIPKFPFIITPFEGKKTGQFSDDSLQMPPLHRNVDDIVQSIEKLLNQSITVEEKISKMLEKIGFLESAFDEFLESNQDRDKMAHFFTGLIPILDNLNFLTRAVENSGEKEWKKGIAIFYEKLFHLFREYHFETLAEIGMTFDPSIHEAVGTVNHPELPTGSIAEVVLKGWKYKKRILRYAKVVVVKEEK